MLIHLYGTDVPDLNCCVRHRAASGILENAVGISAGGDRKCWITLVGGVGRQVMPQRQSLFELRGGHGASGVGDRITWKYRNKLTVYWHPGPKTIWTRSLKVIVCL